MARPFRCGVRLLNVQPEARQAVINAFVQARCPQVRDGRTEPFRHIWDIVRTRAHVHPDYPFEEGPHLRRAGGHAPQAGRRRRRARPHVRVLRRREAHGPRLRGADALADVDGPAPDGAAHVRRGESISPRSSRSSVDYAESLEDVNYLRIFWRIQNKWPDRVFGWIARSMSRRGSRTCATLNYTRLSFDQPPARAPGPAAGAAGHAGGSRSWIESHLRGAGRGGAPAGG